MQLTGVTFIITNFLPVFMEITHTCVELLSEYFQSCDVFHYTELRFA